MSLDREPKALEPGQVEALEALGMTLALEGELLTVHFRDGRLEHWLAVHGSKATLLEVYVNEELMRVGGQHYLKTPGRES